MGGRSTKIIEVVKDDPKVKELELEVKELRRGDEMLERKRRDEMQERKEIREANEEMIRSVMDKVQENQMAHDEEMARTRAEFEERRMKCKEEISKNLKMSEAEHEVLMTKMEVEFKKAQKKLDEQFQKFKKEAEKKLEALEKENEKIKLKGFEDLNAQREEIRRQESESQKKIESIREEQAELRKQMFEEKRAHRLLEIEKTLAAAEKMNDDLKMQHAYKATDEIGKQYLKIIDTIEDTAERLGDIQILCVGELTDDIKNDSEFHLKEIFKSKNDFKTQVRKFRQLLITNSNAQQDVVQLCRDNLRKFENLMISQDFMKLCGQLPNAIKNNKEWAGKVEMLRECAHTLFNEFHDAQTEFTEKYSAIGFHNKKLEILKLED